MLEHLRLLLRPKTSKSRTESQLRTSGCNRSTNSVADEGRVTDDPRPVEHRTKDDWAKLVESWKRSDLTAAEFGEAR